MRPGPLTLATAAVAVATPVAVLRHAAPSPIMLEKADRPLILSPAGPSETAGTAGWIVANTAAAEQPDRLAEPGGPPEVVGIVGRLPDAAVVLVRMPDGAARPLAIGGDVGGWQLRSIASDAALFVNGTRQARVELPAG